MAPVLLTPLRRTTKLSIRSREAGPPWGPQGIRTSRWLVIELVEEVKNCMRARAKLFASIASFALMMMGEVAHAQCNSNLTITPLHFVPNPGGAPNAGEIFVDPTPGGSDPLILGSYIG